MIDAAKKNKELLVELAALRNEDVLDMVKAMKKESSGENLCCASLEILLCSFPILIFCSGLCSKICTILPYF